MFYLTQGDVCTEKKSIKTEKENEREPYTRKLHVNVGKIIKRVNKI